MAPDPTFTSQVTSLQGLLQNTVSLYTTTYLTQASNGSSTANKQLAGLQDNIQTLKAKLANIKKIGDTYDREYLDRTATKTNPIGFWRQRGLSTLQDWVLFIFFLIYGIISLGLVVMVILLSKTPLMSGAATASVAFILGIMMTAVIIRFA